MKSYNQSRLSMSVTKAVMTFKDLFLNPICINACLHYSYGKLLHRNWGDDINIYFLEKLWKRPISYLYASPLSFRKRKTNYVVVGSTLTMLANENSVIWGAGIIDEKAEMSTLPKEIRAVRGPKTREWLLVRGVDCPEVYGDPALLLPRVYTPKYADKRYRLGIIPHYQDYDSEVLENLKADSDVLFIKMEGYSSWTDLVDQIASCDYIASSSLHGLVIAEAYGIPNLWIEITGKLMGGHFKFHDFFQSLHADREQPFIVKQGMEAFDLLSMKATYVKGTIDLVPLIQSSPFQCHFIQSVNR